MKVGDRLPQSFMEKGIDEFSSTDMRQAEPVPVGSSGWQLFIFAAADTVEAPFLKKRLIVGLGGMIAGLLTTILVLVLSSALVAKQEALYLRREMEERNLMQQALAGSEKRYRSLFDSIRDAILVADTDRTVIDCNPAFVDLFGYSREEIVGQKTLALYENEETFIRLGQELETHIDHGEFITRVKFRQKSGTVFNGETKIYYLRDEDDNLLGFIGLIRDISQRLAAEAAIRESEQRFRSVVENAPDAIFVQTQGRFAYLNEAAVILFGAHHAADLVGEPVLDRFHPDYRDLVGERMRILNQERKPVPRLLEVGLRMDGSSVALEASAVPFEMDGRQGALVFVRDMTESHRVRERQVKLEQQLHQAQKMEAVGRLAGGIAHDFNNLLSVILGYGEIVLEELPPLHPHRELMEEVHQAGLRAKDLTRQLLAFSRKQILEMKTVDLNAVVLGFEKLIRRLIGEDIVLKLSLISGELFVKADTGQLEQVLMNLAVNARDAMPDGGLLAIETSVVDLDESYTDKRPDFQPGTYAMVGVSDTGSGMEGDVLPKIFEPFFTTKGQEKGTGLGLATSYGIITQHGGSIWVYSEPGEGSTFKIYLPLSTEPVSKETPSTDQDKPVDRSTTVLVVEDDPSVRQLACSILKKAGYDVIHSENVNDAIVLAAEQRRKIYLVLTDVIMPGMKGPEVFEKIRQSHPEAKVLYMSGYTDNVIVHHGVLMEGIAFIQKPFTAKNLLHKVHHAIVD
jgi:PAS domain S-box-containing protein